MELHIHWWLTGPQRGGIADQWMGESIVELGLGEESAKWLTAYLHELLGSRVVQTANLDLESPSPEAIRQVEDIAKGRSEEPPTEALRYRIAAVRYINQHATHVNDEDHDKAKYVAGDHDG
jgi:hypothetical protein